MSAAFALLGSGEFEPWTADVDRWLTDRPGSTGDRVLILPTASAAEGDTVFEGWAAKGLAHYESLGIRAQVVPLKTREDASRSEFVGALEGASAAYFSGGNPAYLADVLIDTPFWAALTEALDRGVAYAGCSAGVACLGDTAPDTTREGLGPELWRRGLRMFPGTWFGPHWDAMERFAPGFPAFIVSSMPPGATLVGIDEDTAMVGDGMGWSVAGVGGVHVLSEGTWTEHRPGAGFELRLMPD